VGLSDAIPRDTAYVSAQRTLFNSNNLFRINGLGGGRRSTESKLLHKFKTRHMSAMQKKKQVSRTLIHHVTVSLWFGCACILGFNMKHNIRCPEYINLKHEKWETAKPRPPPRQY